MLSSTLNETFSSPIDLLIYTEQYMSAMSNFHSKASYFSLYTQISEIFINKSIGWQDEITALLNKEEYQYTKKLNKTLDLLDRLLLICKDNLNNNIISFLNRTVSLEELETVYQQLTFCIRRVEFGLTEQVAASLIPLLEGWQLSPSFFTWAVKDCLINYTHETLLRLCHILSENGYDIHSQVLYQELKCQI